MTTKKNFSVNPNQSSSESLLKDIRRNTKRIFTSEQKVLIVMEGIRGEHSIAELCRKYGISDSTYYKWNKDFIEADKVCSPENKIYSSSLYRNNFYAYYLLLPAFSLLNSCFLPKILTPPNSLTPLTPEDNSLLLINISLSPKYCLNSL